jgi:hypothetical protein
VGKGDDDQRGSERIVDEVGHSQADHRHGEREKRNWPFLGPGVRHWDDARG